MGQHPSEYVIACVLEKGLQGICNKSLCFKVNLWCSSSSFCIIGDEFRTMSQNFVFGSFYWITNENWLVGGTVAMLYCSVFLHKPNRVDSTQNYCWWKVNQGIHSSLLFSKTVSETVIILIILLCLPPSAGTIGM